MNQSRPFFSVIVPTYNRADLIAKTLQSLQKQDYDNYEIIIVDDGSTDNTAEVVKPFLDARTRYVKKENGERAAARNYGVIHASGAYVNFFDSDDIALSNHLAEAAALVKEKNHPQWFHLGYAWATPEGKIFGEVNHFKGATLNRQLTTGNHLSCNGVFIKREVATQHPFSEIRALSASEDYELWLRLAARYPLFFSNTITSWVVDHETRSVRTIHGEKLISRLKLLLYSVQQDPQVLDYFGDDFKKIKADIYSYIALHLADSPKFKAKSLQYYIQSFITYPGMVGNKRFYVIIKNLLIKWRSS